MKFYNKPRSFTLIELLVSATLLVVLSTTLYQFFANGKWIYKKLNQEFATDSGPSNFYEIFRKDLSHMIAWNQRYIVSQAQGLYFFTFDVNRKNKFAKIEYEIKTDYYRSGKEYSLIRKEIFIQTHHQVFSSKDLETTLIDQCKKFQFSYLGKQEMAPEDFEDEIIKGPKIAEEQNFDLTWFQDWLEPFSPVAIKAEFKKRDNSKYNFKEWIGQGSYSNFESIPSVSVKEGDEDEFL